MPDAKVASYLPDKTQKVYRCNESFILAIINTIHPDYIKAIARASQDARTEPIVTEKKLGEIKIEEKLWQALNAHDFKSRKLLCITSFASLTRI